MMNQIMKENGHLYGMLHTQIAKAFYERYGFREIGNTKKKNRRNIYGKTVWLKIATRFFVQKEKAKVFRIF